MGLVAEGVEIDLQSADFGVPVLAVVLEGGYFGAECVHLLVDPHLLLVVSLAGLQTHAEHLLFGPIHLLVLLGNQLIEADDLRLEHFPLAGRPCKLGIALIDLLLIVVDAVLESGHLLAEQRKLLLALLHLLLQLPVAILC